MSIGEILCLINFYSTGIDYDPRQENQSSQKISKKRFVKWFHSTFLSPQQKYPFSMNVSGQKHYCLMESSDCLSSTFSSSSSFHFYFISFRHSLLYCRQSLRKMNPKEKKSSCQPKLYSHTNYLPPTYTRHITS